MKNFFLLVSLAVCLSTAMANPVVLEPSKSDKVSHKMGIPTVDQDGDVFTLSTDSVTEADVYIKDECGNIIAASSLVLSPVGDQIIVPEGCQDDMYTIEVHTEDDTFTGYINN